MSPYRAEMISLSVAAGVACVFCVGLMILDGGGSDRQRQRQRQRWRQQWRWQ
jgi:hypothetical protein